MFSKIFKIFVRKNTFLINYRYLSGTSKCSQITKPILKKNYGQKEIGPLGWFLLIIPATTFGLGTWQIQRKKWKENLISDLKSRTEKHPINLPQNIDDLKNLEYNPIHVRGHFIHEKEIYMGPRTLLEHGDAATESSLVSKDQNKTQGYLVITPFKLSDRNETILINRGWVPKNLKDPKKRQEGQVSEEVDVIGVVRLHEERPNFMPANKPQSNLWFYKDLNEMSKVTGASPIFLDATTDFVVPNGPIGGQTRITLRNEHLSYILTWYSLSGFTSYLWYKQFLMRK